MLLVFFSGKQLVKYERRKRRHVRDSVCTGCPLLDVFLIDLYKMNETDKINLTHVQKRLKVLCEFELLEKEFRKVSPSKSRKKVSHHVSFSLKVLGFTVKS